MTRGWIRLAGSHTLSIQHATAHVRWLRITRYWNLLGPSLQLGLRALSAGFALAQLGSEPTCDSLSCAQQL